MCFAYLILALQKLTNKSVSSEQDRAGLDLDQHAVDAPAALESQIIADKKHKSLRERFL